MLQFPPLDEGACNKFVPWVWRFLCAQSHCSWALGLLSHPAPGPSLFSSSPGRISHGRAFWQQMTQSHSLQGCGDSIPPRRKPCLRVDWWNPGTPRGHLLETGSSHCLLWAFLGLTVCGSPHGLIPDARKCFDEVMPLLTRELTASVILWVPLTAHSFPKKWRGWHHPPLPSLLSQSLIPPMAPACLLPSGLGWATHPLCPQTCAWE